MASVIGAFSISCTRHPASQNVQTDAAPVAIVDVGVDAAVDAGAAKAFRPQLDGLGFPEGVLALTWDDGPDVHSLELARYLKAQKIAATFFVVKSWIVGVSDDPGAHADTIATGYAHLPILAEYVALGHRVGNHTSNHRLLLAPLAPEAIVQQLADDETELDAVKRTDVHLFRVPGGAWDERASAAVTSSPDLERLIGPVRWDVDRKDWDNSVSCDSTDPKTECEPGPNGHLRTKAAVIAQRYLESIDQTKRGIVLLHDRVGDVGSRYALDLAHVLVPALKARGYVFAGPVLAFSPLRHQVVALLATSIAVDADALHAAGAVDLAVTGDVNGDGRADVCGRADEAVWCALAKPGSGFLAASRWTGPADRAAITAATSLFFVDLDRDGRMDICTNDAMCGYAP